VTKQEFIGRAADAILAWQGYGDVALNGRPALNQTLDAVEMAEAALEAVGAWEQYEALTLIQGRAFTLNSNDAGGREVQRRVAAAIAKAEGR
jgi:hypothetical protein